uniref:Uncharacterized protein n=1 Tax=Arundo donax TaxID=35708 RepID=A0A0A9G435_ARUDO
MFSCCFSFIRCAVALIICKHYFFLILLTTLKSKHSLNAQRFCDR